MLKKTWHKILSSILLWHASACPLMDFFEGFGTFELQRQTQQAKPAGQKYSFDADSADSALQFELMRMERQGLLDIQTKDLNLADSEMFAVKTGANQAEQKLQAIRAKDFDYISQNADFLAVEDRKLQMANLKKQASDEIFALALDFERAQSELDKISREQTQLQAEFQNATLELLVAQERLLKDKQANLSASISNNLIGRLFRRNARQDLEDTNKKLALTQKILANPEQLVESQSYTDFLTPEVLKPYADREAELDARYQETLSAMQQAAKKLDSKTSSYEADFSPWWSDPALVRAKEIRQFKTNMQGSKRIFRR